MVVTETKGRYRMSQVYIVVVRHGEKDGDSLTPNGAAQMYAAVAALIAMFGKIGAVFQRLIHSGANRTRQCCHIAQAAGGLYDLVPEENQGFNFSKTFGSIHGDDRDGFFALMREIRAASGTLAVALMMSEYARRGREVVATAISKLAADVVAKGQTLALVMSHSPWAELAADPAVTPYGLCEADAVIYTIEDGKIIGSELVKAPLPGKPLV